MRCLSVTLILGLFVFSALGQKPATGPSRSKPAATRAKPAPTTPKKLDEQAEWDKALALTDGQQRIGALKKFIKNFPKSARIAEATTRLVTAEYNLANDKLVAGEIDDAVDLYTAAVNDASKPVSGEIWSDQLSKIAPNLYFRGARGEALDITKLLESKVDGSSAQLLEIATFYLSIESGGEAKRVVEAVLKLEPNSAAAYQTLGLAERMDFNLEDSAAAFAKALELEPDSLPARRGLAEMKRSLGKPDEAAALYREILTKDDTNLPARTGLILSLFDAGSRRDAEAAMARSLEANPGNVILLAGAAYWYAANAEGEKAVEYARKAIESDPRFIWSHIALARGLLSQGKPIEAERTLLAARRYGNFPTVEYELASVRLAAGLYREAADDLATSFSVADGTIHTKLGGRVPRDSKYFTELVGYERRASIFAPTAADDPESAAQLRALLELKQSLDAAEPNAGAVTAAADEFIKSDDRMKVHREIFAASQLLDKKVALPKVIEIAKAAPQALDAGLDVPEASTAVLASELYENRRIAAARGEYIAVPPVPRATLSAVLRGRIEEIAGWAYYQMQDSEQATLRLRRAVSVLPADSAYWRSSLWKLGTTLAVAGKDAEALDAYIKSYKGGPPDALRYQAIEAVYRRVNGSTDGLETQIGPNPASPQIAQNTQATPTPNVAEATPSETTAIETSAPSPSPTATSETAEPSPTPTVEIATSSPSPTIELPTPSPTPTVALPAVAPELANAPQIVPIATPIVPESTPDQTPTIEIATPSPTPLETQAPAETPPLPAPTVETTPSPSVDITPTVEAPTAPTPVFSPTPKEAGAQNTSKELFPPVVIKIPSRPPKMPVAKTSPSPTPQEGAEPEPSPTPEQGELAPLPSPVPGASPAPTPAEVRPCSLTVSDETVNLQIGGGDVAVIIGRTDDNELEGLTASSTSPENVTVRQQVIEGMKTRAIFILHPAGRSTGIYQVVFEMPCGRREIVVRLR